MISRGQFRTLAPVVIAVAILTICAPFSMGQTPAEASLDARGFELDGDFALTDHNGSPFHLRQHRGKVALLFFGYTSCAEACPVAMAKIASVYKKLGDESPGAVTLFISLDPGRDTPQALAKYLRYFSVNATGLTGSREEIDRVVKQYGARYEIEKSDSALGYHISHSTYLYAIAPDGKVRYRFNHTDGPVLIASGVKALMKLSSAQ
jgi:protein SCO1/2